MSQLNSDNEGKNKAISLEKICFLVLLIIGIKESAVLNNVFTFVNLGVITLVIVVGLSKVDGSNWKISPNDVRNGLPDGIEIGSSLRRR